MIQCRLALKPDGVFLAANLGKKTLKELRIACTIAQMEHKGEVTLKSLNRIPWERVDVSFKRSRQWIFAHSTIQQLFYSNSQIV
ncbi:putative methyltransferase At1g22800, mitochondrial [Triticum dicoccoides]|uniref:putative methyltransferase At1g22800, mitochondrial n=1 Tax=Triticum dicoccoides TaxID=85692 RepID=UPI00188F24A8|nr:putative methyltransferase At1g22800, mitochondrial [Triticum dicoccoides]